MIRQDETRQDKTRQSQDKTITGELKTTQGKGKSQKKTREDKDNTRQDKKTRQTIMAYRRQHKIIQTQDKTKPIQHNTNITYTRPHRTTEGRMFVTLRLRKS